MFSYRVADPDEVAQEQFDWLILHYVSCREREDCQFCLRYARVRTMLLKVFK